MAKKAVSAGRNVTTIELSEEAMAALESYLGRRGGRGVKKFALSKLVLWFANLPDAAKSAVIGWLDQGVEHAHAEVLRQLAKDIEHPIDDVELVDLTQPKNGVPAKDSSATQKR